MPNVEQIGGSAPGSEGSRKSGSLAGKLPRSLLPM